MPSPPNFFCKTVRDSQPRTADLRLSAPAEDNAAATALGHGGHEPVSSSGRRINSIKIILGKFLANFLANFLGSSDVSVQYTLRRPVMREVLSTRIWAVPPAGVPLL